MSFSIYLKLLIIMKDFRCVFDFSFLIIEFAIIINDLRALYKTS